MPHKVRCGLIQVRCELSPERGPLPAIKQAMLEKHLCLINASRARVPAPCRAARCWSKNS